MTTAGRMTLVAPWQQMPARTSRQNRSRISRDGFYGSIGTSQKRFEGTRSPLGEHIRLMLEEIAIFRWSESMGRRICFAVEIRGPDAN